MPTRRERFIELPAAAPGTTRLIRVVEYGREGARPKAYLQAAIHADEIPGILVLRYLQRLLDDADRSGRIDGHVVLVPMANPVGAGQRVHGRMIGRYSFGDGVNFNRGHADLTDAVAADVGDRLGDDVEENRDLVRAALREHAAALHVADETAALKKTLLGLAIDADICLDLHCDEEALLHAYSLAATSARGAALAAQLGCRALLLADESGGDPFDEAVFAPWLKLARAYRDRPIPAPPLAATIEYRGAADVDARLAAPDADNLLKLLMREKVVRGDPGALPAPLCEATPLAGVNRVRAPHAGVVLLDAKPGERVDAGDVVARIHDPYAPSDADLTEVPANGSGLVYSRTRARMVAPGQPLVAIAGREADPSRKGGLLLSD